MPLSRKEAGRWIIQRTYQIYKLGPCSWRPQEIKVYSKRSILRLQVLRDRHTIPIEARIQPYLATGVRVSKKCDFRWFWISLPFVRKNKNRIPPSLFLSLSQRHLLVFLNKLILRNFRGVLRNFGNDARKFREFNSSSFVFKWMYVYK